MLCYLFKRCFSFQSSRTSYLRWCQTGQAAIVAALAMSAGAAAATPIGAATEPVPVPGADDPVVADDFWPERLIQLLDALCYLLGCAQAQSAVNGPELSNAINRLSLTVHTAGVPSLTDKDRQQALSAAVEASIIADSHAMSLGLTDYLTLTVTLELISAELASGHAQ